MLSKFIPASDQFRILNISCFLESVSAGFPSPAAGHEDDPLDLNQLCIKHPAATYFARLEGDSMIGAGLYSGDILIIDRSIPIRPGSIVVASIDGEFTCKEYIQNPPSLIPHNDKYPVIKLEPGRDYEPFGVVTGVVRLFR
jgi:DNA polymerase V